MFASGNRHLHRFIEYRIAGPAEITVIGPGGISAAATQLITAFEKATGHKVNATFGSGGGTKQRVIRGESLTYRSCSCRWNR